MTQPKPEFEARQELILDAARDLIVRFGYDKTTMGDIAEQAGVTRAIVYLHFDDKDSLFEALLARETRHYLDTWIDAIEKDPEGGTIAGVFRGSLQAVHGSALLMALMRQDRRVFGKYLRKPGNIFAGLQSIDIWSVTLSRLQSVGAVRKEIDPALMGHIMNAMAVGLMNSLSEDSSPPYDAVLEAVVDMMERVMTPDDGGNQAKGRAIIQNLAQAMRIQFEGTLETDIKTRT